jgi:glycosyltransferase involved in cell wall biosynthesis
VKQALLIVRSFPPVRHSGTIRVEAFARHLISYGYQPSVMCGATPPNLRDSPDRSIPDDRRVEVDLSLERSWLRRRWSTLPLGFFFERQRSRATNVHRIVQSCIDRGIRPDVVFASCQPGDMLIFGLAVARHFGCPLICDFRDPWSHWPMPLYPHWVDFALERSVERRIVQASTAITVTTQASSQILQQAFQIPASHIHVIANGYESADFERIESFDPISADQGRFHVVYTGEIGTSRTPGIPTRIAKALGFQYDPLKTNYPARSPRYFLEGLARFISQSPSRVQQVRAWFIGDANVSKDPAVQAFPYPEVLRIHPRVPPAAAAGAMQQANLLLMLQLETFFQGQPLCVAIPGKLYSYLASGKRILAAVQKSENTELIERFQAGTCVSPTSASEFAAAIAAEFERWKSGTAPPDQPRKIPEFERAYQTGQLAQLFDSLLTSSSRSPAAAATA